MVIVPAERDAALAPLQNDLQTIRALVVDSHSLMVAALGTLLAAPPLCATVVTASRSDEALDLIAGAPVNLILCSLDAQPMSGSLLARRISDESPDVPVILLGGYEGDAELVAALNSGAAGLFPYDVTVDEFMAGVISVLAGHRAIASAVMSRLMIQLGQPRPALQRSALDRLSPTELDILTMVGKAETVPNIAASRGISRKTVRNHLAKIYRKLELHGRAEAMLWAARVGLTSPL